MIVVPTLGVLLRQAWAIATVRHGLLVCLCLGSFGVQQQYRVPGWAVFVLLPWVGLALSALSVLFLFRRLLGWLAASETVARVLYQIERGATLLALGYAGYGLVLAVNGALYTSAPAVHASEISDIQRTEVDLGVVFSVQWAELRSWNRSGRTERVVLTWNEGRRLWAGQPVLVRVRRGYFGIPWVAAIEADEEQLLRRIVAQVPAAGGAWKQLVLLYLERHRWDDAANAAHEYLKHYPHDAGYALQVAGPLGLAYRNADVLRLLEPVLATRPTARVYATAGVASVDLGDHARAQEFLEQAITLAPNDYRAYYYLGLLHTKTRRYAEAEAVLKRALELNPDFAEAERQLRKVGREAAAEKARQTP